MQATIRLSKRNHTIKVVHKRKRIQLKHTGHRGPSGTVAVGETTTLPPGSEANVNNSGTNSAAILDFFIPEGDKGDVGDTGVSTFVRIHHGNDPNVARPNALYVEWVGTVAPINGTTEDTWVDTA